MEKQNQQPQIEGLERRTFRAELRAEENPESRRVSGYAAVFNSESEDLGGFTEVIEPGAFRDALLTSDVRALFNHNPSMILGRTSAGTLKLTEDERGLHYEFDAPNTTAGNDLLVSLRRGDVKESSFAFVVAKEDQDWEEVRSANGERRFRRKIKKMKRVDDISPVTYPAYQETTAALRSLDAFKAETVPPTESQTPDDETEIFKRLLLALEAKKRAIQ